MTDLHRAPASATGVIEETPAADLERAREIQRPIARLPGWEQYLGWLYLVVLLGAVAWLGWFPRAATAYNTTLALTVLLTIVLATSWNILSGFGGYTSFGHAGFFGIGSYVGALLLFYERTSWVPAVILAGLATSLIALAIGYPTLRLRGPYFAITMLGLTELARIVVTAWDSLTLGGNGVYLPILRLEPPVTSGPLLGQARNLFHNNQNYYAMLLLTVVTVVISYAVGTSRFGLELLAIRDDEGAAQAMGIRTTRVKLAAFALSSFFPGAAGAIYARHVGFIDPPSVFLVIWSIRAIAPSILGGQGTILGPILGAVVLTLVTEEAWERDPNLYQIILGGLIVLVVLFIPGGIIALLQDRGWLPRSRRI